MKLHTLILTLAFSLPLAASCIAEETALSPVVVDKSAPEFAKIAPQLDLLVSYPAVVGKLAPEFTLKDTDGKEHSLAEFKGKFVVLEWVNFGCPFVKKHYGSGNMQGLQAEYTGKGVIWLSICSSAPGKQGYFEGEALKKQIAEHQSRATFYLTDGEGKVGRMYGAKTTPHMYAIDPAGTLVYAGGIDDIPSADIADLAKAKNYVRLTLDAALAGQPISPATSQPYGCSVKYAEK